VRQLFYVQQFKIFILEGAVLGGSPSGGPPNLFQIIVSQMSSYIVSFNFLCWAVQKFHFGRAIVGFAPPPPTPRNPNLVQTIVSQTTSYILSFNFLCWAVQKFYLKKSYFGVWDLPPRGPPTLVPWKAPKFGPNNCHTSIFLHYEFQTCMSSSSKIWPWKGHFLDGGRDCPSQRTPKFSPNNYLTNNFVH